MRITKESARVVSRYAGVLSNGYVAEVGTGSDIGRGSRILDGNSQYVWLSKPRAATAYYLGQVDAFTHARGMVLADYPGEVAEIRAELRGNGDREVDEWYSLGIADGTSRLGNYCPEIRDAGVPRA
jgi:hypothetical protein